MGDAVMQKAFERVIGPAAAHFQPNIISMSHRDPALGMRHIGPAAAPSVLLTVNLLCVP